MARPRDIACPCGHVFSTRANPNVRIKCSACGAYLRAPAVGTDPWRGPVHSGAPSGPEESPLAPTGGVAIVEQGSPTTVKARRSSPKPATAMRERPAEELTPAQQAGRRGGLSRGIARRMGR